MLRQAAGLGIPLDDLAGALAGDDPAGELSARLQAQLSDEDRELLATLAAAGGAPLGAGRVADATGRPDAPDRLARLNARGLLQSRSPRYTLAGALAEAPPTGRPSRPRLWRPRLPAGPSTRPRRRCSRRRRRCSRCCAGRSAGRMSWRRGSRARSTVRSRSAGAGRRGGRRSRRRWTSTTPRRRHGRCTSSARAPTRSAIPTRRSPCSSRRSSSACGSATPRARPRRATTWTSSAAAARRRTTPARSPARAGRSRRCWPASPRRCWRSWWPSSRSAEAVTAARAVIGPGPDDVGARVVRPTRRRRARGRKRHPRALPVPRRDELPRGGQERR